MTPEVIMNQIKERLDALDESIRENDDWYLWPLFLHSRDNFMKYINESRIVDKPLIGVIGDGRITAEWRDEKDKILSYVICDDKGCELKICN